ncbi:hypothetical protein ACFLZQ_08485, partial [Thermodesulfobacteriota bacterium]
VYVISPSSVGNPILDEDNRKFASAYFIIDITNPEELPTLLGEITYTTDGEDLDNDAWLDVVNEDTIVVNGLLDVGEDQDGDGHLDDGTEDVNGNGILDGEIELGYTMAIPTVVPMNDGTDTTWYLILGSGPTSHNPIVNALKGTSDQNARLAVIPLHDRMNPVSGLKSLRIPTALPAASGVNEEFGTIRVLNADGSPYKDSFISDLITVDLETFPDYKADVVYFGTVTGDWTDGSGIEGWGGRLYRMVTRSDGSGAIFTGASSQMVTKPSEWPTLLSGGTPSLLNPNIMYDAGKPIISAPTVGTDGIDFWVYFGTGRFFDAGDKRDSGSNAAQTFYGIREPVLCSAGTFAGPNWLTVPNTSPEPEPPGYTVPVQRGGVGLLKVEDIAIQQVAGAQEDTAGVVGCYNGGNFDPDIDLCFDGIPADHPLKTYGSFGDFLDYITGADIYCYPGDSPGFDGWSRDMLHYKERNLGQATLLGGLISYSSYIPDTNICNQEGSGYLYGHYYQSGTAWYEDVFGRSPIINAPIDPGIYMGKGLSTTPNIHVGEQEGGKAFIQTSVGQIVEIPQPNLPITNIKTGRIKWYDIE